jgi:hypothetical protein
VDSPPGLQIARRLARPAYRYRESYEMREPVPQFIERWRCFQRKHAAATLADIDALTETFIRQLQ